jgi:hypothetical protein
MRKSETDFERLFFTTKFNKMEGAKALLISVLTVAAGVAVYDMLLKPILNKAKTAMPSAGK